MFLSSIDVQRIRLCRHRNVLVATWMEQLIHQRCDEYLTLLTLEDFSLCFFPSWLTLLWRAISLPAFLLGPVWSSSEAIITQITENTNTHKTGKLV